MEADIPVADAQTESPSFDRDTPGVPSSQVISLDRNCFASSVTVMYFETSSAGSSQGQEDQNKSPFFLVSNRKSGRKAARH